MRSTWPGTVTAVLALAVALLTGCEVTDEPGPSEPSPTGAAPDDWFNFCETVDLDEASDVADELGVSERLGAEGQPMRVTSRRAANVATTSAQSEICRYGAELGQMGFSLQAYPGGRDRDIPPGAEPREELGEGAYFLDAHDGWFVLSAPAADAYLSLTGIFSQLTDAADAEEGLARLLRPAIEQVPPGAALAGLDAGEECEVLEAAVTRALDAPPELSRHTVVNGSFSCDFTTSTTGRTASISLHRGAVIEQWVNPDLGWQELDGLDDAWIDNAGVILASAGDDVVRVHMLGVPDDVEGVDEELAAEVVPILASD